LTRRVELWDIEFASPLPVFSTGKQA